MDQQQQRSLQQQLKPQRERHPPQQQHKHPRQQLQQELQGRQQQPWQLRSLWVCVVLGMRRFRMIQPTEVSPKAAAVLVGRLYAIGLAAPFTLGATSGLSKAAYGNVNADQGDCKRCIPEYSTSSFSAE